MSRANHFLIVFSSLVLIPASLAIGQQTSDLINQALDQQLPARVVSYSGPLPSVLAQISNQTDVPIRVDPSAYAALPWGEQTTIRSRFQGKTLGQALTAICQTLGLKVQVEGQAVVLQPAAALVRLGRRATVEELRLLDVLATRPLGLEQSRITAYSLLTFVNQQLAKTGFAVEDRAFTPTDEIKVNLASNYKLAQALDEIVIQTKATWFPWGRTIVVLPKRDQIRMQLSKRINTRFNGDDVSDVLLELAHQCGLTFRIDPGAVQRIPDHFRTIQMTLSDATIEQALESLCGFTYLQYSINDDGEVHISYVGSTPPPAAAPTTRPVGP